MEARKKTGDLKGGLLVLDDMDHETMPVPKAFSFDLPARSARLAR
ncbi:MAG TPA: hypothetical protein VLX68_12585 [Chitinivibrionales bacterium]|nr:hypothetical protein [Chitinivibrionales bacterium]